MMFLSKELRSMLYLSRKSQSNRELLILNVKHYSLISIVHALVEI